MTTILQAAGGAVLTVAVALDACATGEVSEVNVRDGVGEGVGIGVGRGVGTGVGEGAQVGASVGAPGVDESRHGAFLAVAKAYGGCSHGLPSASQLPYQSLAIWRWATASAIVPAQTCALR